ncbi:unnamed protein product [Symbiodinium sp. CCMP2456]|nr:unnamed protein product [Symbiodinium sp. CCMP2456]
MIGQDPERQPLQISGFQPTPPQAEETEQNEPIAAQLDTITSKRDSQTASIQSSVDPAGHLRITKTKQKVEMPQNSEAYRRVIKVEGYAWLAMQARYKSKSWLQDLTMADFTAFVDFVLGERVAGLRLEQATGYDNNNNAQFRPPWGIVLRYEYRMRKEAFRLVNEDGMTLKAALLAVTKDTEMKEVHFVTPLTLTAFPMPTNGSAVLIKGIKGEKVVVKAVEVKVRGIKGMERAHCEAFSWPGGLPTAKKSVSLTTIKDAPGSAIVPMSAG